MQLNTREVNNPFKKWAKDLNRHFSKEDIQMANKHMKRCSASLIIESEVAQSCLTLCNPMGCSLPGSSVHGIFQARVLEWSAIAFSGRSNKELQRNRSTNLTIKKYNTPGCLKEDKASNRL